MTVMDLAVLPVFGVDSVRWHHAPGVFVDDAAAAAEEAACVRVADAVDAAWTAVTGRAARDRAEGPALHRLISGLSKAPTLSAAPFSSNWSRPTAASTRSPTAGPAPA